MVNKFLLDEWTEIAVKMVRTIPTILGEEAAMLAQDIQNETPEIAYENFIVPFIKRYLIVGDVMEKIQNIRKETDHVDALEIFVRVAAQQLIALLEQSYI